MRPLCSRYPEATARRAAAWACLLLLARVVPGWGADVPAPPEFRPVAEFVRAEVAAGKVPSVAVAVVKEQRVVWAEGFGLADRERGVPATADSVYRLASISKPITATGLVLLKDRGLIDLDAPANRYLPEARLRAPVGSADAMTVRRVANHTAGLPIHYSFYYDGQRPPSVDDAIRRYGFACRPPGSGWEYSNLGYGVLDRITEAVAGTPWAEYMTHNLYAPLGMTRTRHGLGPGSVVQYAADVAGQFVPVAYYTFDHPGGSIVCSSAADMARFARLHLGGGVLDDRRLLREETVREMQEPTGKRPDGSGYGVGWFVDTYHGQRCVYHSGGMPGVSTLLRLFPEHQAACIILTNCDTPGITQAVSTRIAEVLFPGSEAKPAKEAPPAPGEPKEWRGVWKGKLVLPSGEVPLTLTVKSATEVLVRVGTRPEAPVREASLRGRRLAGRVDGHLETRPDYHGIPALRLELGRQEERATGVLVAAAPGYFSLSYFVDLEKQP